MLSNHQLDSEMFADLAAVLDSRVKPGLIGIEGTPFAGKSTLAARLAVKLGASVVSEHTDFNLDARELALTPWPEDLASSAARQRYFYAVEKSRIKAALDLLLDSPSVIMDRTVLSVAAYSFVRAARSLSSFHQFPEDLNEIFGEAQLLFPAQLYLLEVPTNVLLQRAGRLVDVGKPRPIEPFLLEPPTLELLKWFYVEITSRLTRCEVVRSDRLI